MNIQDSFIVNCIKASLDDTLGRPDPEDTIHEEVASYITDMYLGSGLIIDDSVEAIQDILDYISQNSIKTRLQYHDSDDINYPDSFKMILVVHILDTAIEFEIATKIRRQYRSVFP